MVKLSYYLKWVLWVLFVQILLINISSAIYAYKFTHFYSRPAPAYSSQNIFDKTWKLFVGPDFYKNSVEPEPSFPYQSVRIKSSDDIILDAWYSTVDSAKGCVVFFHGITVNKSFVEKEAGVFRQWGYNLLLVDFRGHGRSTGNRCSFGIKETDDIQNAFAFARQKGNTRIILYGVSLGAVACIRAVSENKLQPTAVIADMPFGTLHHHFQSRARVLGFPSEPFASLVTFWIGVEGGFNAFRHDVTKYAKNVGCPILLEWGEKDRYVGREEMEKLYTNLPSKHKKFVVYSNADHESFLHVDPNTWEREVKAFMNGL